MDASINHKKVIRNYSFINIMVEGMKKGSKQKSGSINLQEEKQESIEVKPIIKEVIQNSVKTDDKEKKKKKSNSAYNILRFYVRLSRNGEYKCPKPPNVRANQFSNFNKLIRQIHLNKPRLISKVYKSIETNSCPILSFKALIDYLDGKESFVPPFSPIKKPKNDTSSEEVKSGYREYPNKDRIKTYFDNDYKIVAFCIYIDCLLEGATNDDLFQRVGFMPKPGLSNIPSIDELKSELKKLVVGDIHKDKHISKAPDKIENQDDLEDQNIPKTQDSAKAQVIAGTKEIAEDSSIAKPKNIDSESYDKRTTTSNSHHLSRNSTESSKMNIIQNTIYSNAIICNLSAVQTINSNLRTVQTIYSNLRTVQNIYSQINWILNQTY